GMGPGDVGHGLDLGHFHYPQIGLPPLKPIKGIVVGAKVLGPLALPAKRVVKHPAKSDPADASGMDAEPQDAARELIHDDQDPVSPARWPTRIGTDLHSKGCPSCGPGMLARIDPRSPVPVGSDGRESFEPRLCRWGWRKPGQSAERCADSPRWDCAASSGRRHQ